MLPLIDRNAQVYIYLFIQYYFHLKWIKSINIINVLMKRGISYRN